MKSIYKGTGIIAILFIVVSCSFSKKQAANRMETNDIPQLEIVVLDPGHFHASLLQKETLTDVGDTIRIYAPKEQASINIWKALILITSGRNLLRHGKNKYIPEMIISRKCLPIIKVM